MGLTFEEYAEKAGVTAVYPNRGDNIVYPVLGLVGESGEVAEKLKKLIRDQNGMVDDAFRDAVERELGDILWYLAAVAHELGLTLDDVAEVNIAKLQSRAERGKIQGSGDDR